MKRSGGIQFNKEAETGTKVVSLSKILPSDSICIWRFIMKPRSSTTNAYQILLIKRNSMQH